MRGEFNRASYDVNTRQSKTKVAKVMTEIGGPAWSFLQDHVDSVGNQLRLSQDPAKTQSKNGEKNLFAATPEGCDILSLAEKLIEVENSWNNVVFWLSLSPLFVYALRSTALQPRP